MKSGLVLIPVALSMLAADEELRTDALFQEFSKPGSPGCVVGVTSNGRTLFKKGYGKGDLEQGTALTPASVFYLASVSKQFLAFSVLLLEQQGKLSIEEPIGKYVKGLPDHTARVTLRQLLHHTGGVRDYLSLGFISGLSPDHVWSEEAALRAIARQKSLNFDPGTEHLYSNSGYVLLSLALQQVIGGKLNDWMSAQVYKPLGMTSSRWQHDHRDPIPSRAHGYIAASTAWKTADSMLDTIGDGGMYSSVDDLLQWARNFDEPRLAPAALARMAEPGRLHDGKVLTNGYGMGLVSDRYRGLAVVGHGGALGGYRTMLLRIPERKLTTILLCNAGSANASDLVRKVASIWLPNGFPETSPDPPPPKPDKPVRGSAPDIQLHRGLLGEWWGEELRAVYSFHEDGPKLYLRIGDAPSLELLATPDGRLQTQSGLFVHLLRDGERRITGFEIQAGRVHGIKFTRLAN
jgi:CubicO group peptidase (beta-lactamase class C family)